MTIKQVLDYAKQHDIAATALKLSPHFDVEKGRVSKGTAIGHKEWKKKGRWEAKNTRFTPFDDSVPYAYMVDLTKAGIFVIDIDVKGGKTAKDVLKPQIYENLLQTCGYVVETGSKGLHCYFLLPPLQEGEYVKKATNIEECKEWFVEGESGAVDIITDHIITEGTAYQHEGTTYQYRAIEGSITDILYQEPHWEAVKPFILHNKKEEHNQYLQRAVDILQKPIDVAEIKDHLDNIDNTVRDWERWYKISQALYNTLPNEEGFALFDEFSRRHPLYNYSTTRQHWNGLTKDAVNPLTIGTLLRFSRQSNEINYHRIRCKYGQLSYVSLKMLWETNHFFLEEPTPSYVRINERSTQLYTPRQFKDLLADQFFLKLVEGKEVRTSFYEAFHADPTKRRYKKMEHYPNVADCPQNVYNSYIPPEASFLPQQETFNVETIQPILHHLAVMTNEVADTTKVGVEYVLDWLAQLLQQPTHLAGVALIFYGEEGAGKDILFDWFGQYVLGNHLYNKAGNMKNLFKDFNGVLEGKHLAHLDELELKVIVKYNEDLKRIITNGQMTLERKGVDAKSVMSCLRLVGTTNNKDALKISPTDRRFNVYESSSMYLKNTEYFKQLWEHLKKPTTIRAFYDYLLQRDISSFDHTKRPITKLYKDMKQASVEPLLLWISEMEDGDNYRKTTEWCAAYNTWATTNHLPAFNPVQFGITVGRWADKIGNDAIVKKSPKNISHYLIDKPKIVSYMVANDLLDTSTPVNEIVEQETSPSQ